MKGLLVLGLGLFVAGFWITLIACVGRDKTEIQEPAKEEGCGPPQADAVLEVKFPVNPGLKSPATRESMTVEPAQENHPAPSEPDGSSHSMLNDPETWDLLAEMERKAALPKTYEDLVREVRALEATHLVGNHFSQEQRDFMAQEARNGWGGDMQGTFRYWASAWGYELVALEVDATSPE